MFSDLVESKNKKPDTEHIEALYNGELSIQDISVREALEIAKFYNMPLPFFINVCEAEHPTNDLNILSEKVKAGKEKMGPGHFIASCLEKRLVDIYWYLGFYKGSYYYLDVIDEFCALNGIKEIENYNNIRWSDRTMFLGRKAS